jgi:hypothetical protein
MRNTPSASSGSGGLVLSERDNELRGRQQAEQRRAEKSSLEGNVRGEVHHSSPPGEDTYRQQPRRAFF